MRSTRRYPLVVARQPIVGERLPGRGVGDVLPRRRAHAGVATDRSEAHAHGLAAPGVADEERRAAGAAEDLRPAALGHPLAQLLLALRDDDRPGLDQR